MLVDVIASGGCPRFTDPKESRWKPHRSRPTLKRNPGAVREGILYASLSAFDLAFAPLYRLSKTWTICVSRSANVLARNFLRSFTPSCSLSKAAFFPLIVSPIKPGNS